MDMALNNSNVSVGSINANNLNNSISSNGNKKKRSYDFQNRKIRRRIWQEDEVHKLICVWAMRLDDLRQSKKNRHIYEEISDELNQMGLDTIREEVHIKIQNLSQLYRNEKRRIEGTGEAPTWQYYHEVDELLGSNADNSMDVGNLDESNVALSVTTKDEIVSIGDSGSENELDESQDEHLSKNGYENSVKKPKLMQEQFNAALPSRSPTTPHTLVATKTTSTIKPQQYQSVQPQTTSSNSNERKSMTTHSSLDALLQAIESANSINDTNLSPSNVQLEILKEMRKANALAEIERREAKILHQEMKDLEEQRFNLTQMFIERSLTLQKQMLESLRSVSRDGNANSFSNTKSSMNGGGSGSSSSDNSFKFLPRQQSSRPQFILAKKKK